MTKRQHLTGKSLKQMAQDLKDGGMQCNCDLDRWQPQLSTGHAFNCRIHINATQLFRKTTQ